MEGVGGAHHSILTEPPPTSCRYKQRAQAQRGVKVGGGSQHPMVPLCPPVSPLSAAPLLPPAAPPGPLHVTNLDYFLSGK